MRVKIEKNEEVQAPKVEVPVPQFSETQKLAIRNAQFQSLKLREQARQFVDQAQGIDVQVAQFINKAAAELKIDPKLFSFDVDTISFQKLESK